MTDLITRLRAAKQRRAAYRQTVAELSRMPLDVALDLDIARGDIPRIARQAVYGA